LRVMRSAVQMRKARLGSAQAGAAALSAPQRTHPANLPASAARAGAALGTKRSKWDQGR
jgi:hypothetical protein